MIVRVTGPECWDGRSRLSIISEEESGQWVVRLQMSSGDTTLYDEIVNASCPAHTYEEAFRLQKVLWMDRLGYRFAETDLAKEAHAEEDSSEAKASIHPIRA